jgi:hypothetical protein
MMAIIIAYHARGDAESVRGRRPRPPLWTIVPNKALSLSLSLWIRHGVPR